MRRILFIFISTLIASLLVPVSAQADTSFTCQGSDGQPASASYTVSGGVLGDLSHCYGALFLNSTVTQINYATYATHLTSIVIPTTTLTIGNDPFIGPLTSITVDPSNLNYKSDASGVLYSKDGTSLIEYPQNAPGTTYTVPSGTTTMGSCGFSSLANLQIVTIPASVISMNTGFENCSFPSTSSLQAINVSNTNAFYSSIDGVLLDKNQTQLFQYPIGKTDTSYTVPATVQSIERYAFALNRFAQNVMLPNGLLSIGVYAFFENSGITSINIPASLTTFGQYPFLGASHLAAINVDSSNTVVESISGVVYSKDGTQLIEYPDGKTDTNFVVPSTVTTILAQWVWTNPYLINLTIPSSVTSIGYGILGSASSNRSYLVFSGNSSLSSIQGSYAATVVYCGTNNAALTSYVTTQSLVTKCETTGPAFTISNTNEIAQVGNAITGFIAVTTSSPDFYAISPALGSNLTFNHTTGTLSGTPLNSSPLTVYTITGYNAFGSVTAQYSLQINGISPTPIPVPDPVQTDTITAVTPSSFVAGTLTPIVITRKFTRTIVAIDAGSVRLTPARFTQSPTTVSFSITPQGASPLQITLYNGAVPVLSQLVVIAPAPKPAVIPTPTPAAKILSCVSKKHSYTPLASECLVGYTPKY